MAFLKERGRSFRYAFTGIAHAFRTQPNLWIHSVAIVITIAAGFLLRINSVEWIFIIAAIGVVITTEIINTAIEELVDLVSPERHEKAGIVKDLAAGAVLIAAIMALIIGCIIFIPKILLIFAR